MQQRDPSNWCLKALGYGSCSVHQRARHQGWQTKNVWLQLWRTQPCETSSTMELSLIKKSVRDVFMVESNSFFEMLFLWQRPITLQLTLAHLPKCDSVVSLLISGVNPNWGWHRQAWRKFATCIETDTDELQSRRHHSCCQKDRIVLPSWSESKFAWRKKGPHALLTKAGT